MVGNKIRVQYKIFNPDRIAFVETLTSLLTQLAQYIKSYHLVGVTWNPKGGDVSNYTASSAKVAAPAGGGMANVFTSIKSIDQSGGKTAGLNKVTKEHADLTQGLQGRRSSTVACCSRCRQEADRTRQDRQACTLRRA
ncbi:hypothetical protein PC121_g6145 [Phytophthora cactorum]|nr:hypothetical protein PC120_g6869 [Phytophthora cactorum]KAG3082383.1 hypothetical protein PC121_g6145 [Phytophthora cactorum]